MPLQITKKSTKINVYMRVFCTAACEIRIKAEEKYHANTRNSNNVYPRIEIL